MAMMFPDFNCYVLVISSRFDILLKKPLTVSSALHFFRAFGEVAVRYAPSFSPYLLDCKESLEGYFSSVVAAWSFWFNLIDCRECLEEFPTIVCRIVVFLDELHPMMRACVPWIKSMHAWQF